MSLLICSFAKPRNPWTYIVNNVLFHTNGKSQELNDWTWNFALCSTVRKVKLKEIFNISKILHLDWCCPSSVPGLGTLGTIPATRDCTLSLGPKADWKKNTQQIQWKTCTKFNMRFNDPLWWPLKGAARSPSQKQMCMDSLHFLRTVSWTHSHLD